jgi:hypothetical protein
MFNDKDDFWNIEKLVPKKKTSASPFSTKEKTVEYTVSGNEEKKSEENKLTLIPQAEKAETRTYAYNYGFVKNVTISSFNDRFDFYGSFRKAALVYYDFKTAKCDFEPFFSYMPQYSQLNSKQKSFYFYWRDSVRRENYIRTDYSYLYLYVYEILNLPDKIPPERGLELLIALWRAYRAELPNIDVYMSLVVQDYCLIYNLICPIEKISDFIFDIVSSSEFKEFYLADSRYMGASGVDVMLAYLSDYDWRRGKYAGGDTKEVYSKHLLSAMGALINRLWDSGEIFNSENGTAHIKRKAFRNSLCTHSVKCQLDIEYILASASGAIRGSVTAALRYTENRLRALIGTKSRLAVKGLPDAYKAVIDEYFDGLFAKVNKTRIAESQPEYEKLYDAEDSEMSLDGADEIERSSWSTTARLVSEEEEVTAQPEPEVSIERAEAIAQSDSDTYGLTAGEMSFIGAILSGDSRKMLSLAKELRDDLTAIAERINEAFADGFGDVIIEGESPDYNIIEDYKEDIKEWLLKVMK